MRRRAQSLTFALLASSVAMSVCAQTPAKQTARQSADPHVNFDVLSDIRGVQLNSYFGALAPELKQGFLNRVSATGIETLAPHSEVDLLLTIAADGKITALRMETGTQDSLTAKAAWEATIDSTYAPLPAALTGSPLELRVRFVVS